MTYEQLRDLAGEFKGEAKTLPAYIAKLDAGWQYTVDFRLIYYSRTDAIQRGCPYMVMFPLHTAKTIIDGKIADPGETHLYKYFQTLDDAEAYALWFRTQAKERADFVLRYAMVYEMATRRERGLKFYNGLWLVSRIDFIDPSRTYYRTE